MARGAVVNVYLLIVIATIAVIFAIRADASSEITASSRWAAEVFSRDPVPTAPIEPGLDIRRQDHGELRINESILRTPLQIGSKKYAHGLGSHSTSEIVVNLPAPGKTFTAEVGIDNNYDTGGQRGSVVFAVDVNGAEAFRSDIRRGGQEPLAVNVDLKGARTFTLHISDAGDGPGWDQSDWADASVLLEDGKQIRLDELPVCMPAQFSTSVPFSFIYGGKPSSELIQSWKMTRTEGKDGRTAYIYSDSKTGLEVTCDVKVFDDYPAVEWVLHFTNKGTVDTPIIEKILPLDMGITTPSSGDVILHRLHGSNCTSNDFLPIDDKVEKNAAMYSAPSGGRSSDTAFPFFNLQWGNGGIVGAIGWSGQWAMDLRRDGGSNLILQAGQEITHLKLHPGESIRTPRILVLMYRGDDRWRGNNLLRRLLLAHYVPKKDGKLIIAPVTQNTWFTYQDGNGTTEENQLSAQKVMKSIGVEAYWLDAGWFEGGWPRGAGSWVPRKDNFPNGLKPIGDGAHEKGMDFVLWFEPERVTHISRIASEHPEWVMNSGPGKWDPGKDSGDGLYNLGIPEARQWLTDYLSKCFSDWGVDVFRCDFNIDPLRFWKAADEPDRQGMAEIRYIEGLYRMWDELTARKSGLWIDNCASGGRRIDLETVSRSIPLWHSDTQCYGRPMPVQDQVQTAGLTQYVPLHSAGVWGCDPYVFRSIATTGTNLCQNITAESFDPKAAKKAIDELKSLRQYYSGDFYPLMDVNLDERQWIAWQFDNPEAGGGFAMFFRRSASQYTAAEIGLRGLDSDAVYDVAFVDSKKKVHMTGAELAKLRVDIPSAPSSALVVYKNTGK